MPEKAEEEQEGLPTPAAAKTRRLAPPNSRARRRAPNGRIPRPRAAPARPQGGARELRDGQPFFSQSEHPYCCLWP